MSRKIFLRKTYSVYASDMHLATMIFPFVNKEIEKGAIIKPILEKSVSKNINHIIQNIHLNPDLKERINEIDWEETNIEKIRKTLNDMDSLLESNIKINIIVEGTNEFIEKVNELIDVWAKVNFENIEKSNSFINIINCYNFEYNKNINEIKTKHDYLLNTLGIQEIFNKEELKKAN